MYRVQISVATLSGIAMFGVFILAIFLVGPFAWDDGAITVAFARSLGSGGKMALTLASERVEGTSSLLYTFLLAALIPSSEAGFLRQILTSQILSLASLLTLVAVLFAALRPALPSAAGRIAVLALFTALPMHLAETMNGMEMELFALLLTLIVLAVRAGSRWVHALIVLCLLARFEAAFYLGVMALALAVLDRDRRRYHAAVLMSLMIAFSVLTLCRWLYFGDVMPNTVWAKMHPPYSMALPPLQALRAKLNGPIELVTTTLPLLLLAAALAMVRASAAVWRDPALWIMAGFALFAGITGANSGYTGRMFVGMLPVALLCLCDQLVVADAARDSDRLVARPMAILGVLVLALTATFCTNWSLFQGNVLQVLKAGVARSLLPADLAGLLAPRLEKVRFPANPWEYRHTGMAADAVRRLLGQNTLRFMGPDIGGVGLCCAPTALEVIDSALLANRDLSHQGYDGFANQFMRHPPDLLVTHRMWSEQSRIYDNVFFRDQYRPLVFRNLLFWIRADRLEMINNRYPERVTRAGADFDISTLRNDFGAIDLDYMKGGNRYPVTVLGDGDRDAG